MASMAPPRLRCRSVAGACCPSLRAPSPLLSSSWMSNSGPRSEKYTSKTVSNAFQWALLFTSVAPKAYLKASRSSSGMWRTASVASRFSVNETGSPADRSSEMNPARRSSTLALVGRSGALGDGELLGRLLDVGAVLEQDVQRVAGLLGSDRRSEEHTSELQSPCNLVCRLLLE